MVKIRAFQPTDLEEIRKLHELYYAKFEFPPFSNCLNAFVIEDEKDEIVMACAIEKVAEGMLVTNKAKSEIKIGRALIEAQGCSIFTCKVNGIRDFYAFTDENAYAQHFIKHGFIESDRVLKLRIT